MSLFLSYQLWKSENLEMCLEYLSYQLWKYKNVEMVLEYFSN